MVSQGHRVKCQGGLEFFYWPYLDSPISAIFAENNEVFAQTSSPSYFIFYSAFHVSGSVSNSVMSNYFHVCKSLPISVAQGRSRVADELLMASLAQLAQTVLANLHS